MNPQDRYKNVINQIELEREKQLNAEIDDMDSKQIDKKMEGSETSFSDRLFKDAKTRPSRHVGSSLSEEQLKKSDEILSEIATGKNQSEEMLSYYQEKRKIDEKNKEIHAEMRELHAQMIERLNAFTLELSKNRGALDWILEKMLETHEKIDNNEDKR